MGVSKKEMEQIEFVVFENKCQRFHTQYDKFPMTSPNDMRHFRAVFKSKFKLPYLGHIFVQYSNPAIYSLLKEWLVLYINEAKNLMYKTIYMEPPHVIVFDMDSTLITEEEEVRIRDPRIYEGLDKLKKRNCILCLWSYGDREHVVHSLRKVNLSNYFNIILAEGRKSGEYSTEDQLDNKRDVYYKSTPFYLNVPNLINIPKSPRVVLYYLKTKGVQYIKSITLVDDLYDNDFNYDHFVHIHRCPVPVNDWHEWQHIILLFIDNYDFIYK